MSVLRLARPAPLTVAGRTDAGVHATGQVAHVELPPRLDVATLERKLNGWLPPDVAVHRVRPAPASFDARFSALSRRYTYRIADRVVEPLRRHDTAAHRRPLDVPAMNQAAIALLGEHDFAAYCRARPGATTVRKLLRLRARRYSGVVVLDVEADAFCHGMVRSLVGALVAVGDGRRPTDWPAQLLAAARRDSRVSAAAAHGLTLVAVSYPPVAQLASRVALTRNLRVLSSAL